MSSEPERLPHLVTCVGVDTEYGHLAHFLKHYLALGVAPQHIHVLLNTRDPASANLARAETLLAHHGIAEPKRWIAPYTSDSMWAQRREIQRDRVPAGAWVISADVDEFHEYPEPLARFIALCEASRVNCVQGVFIDRLAPAGHLAPVTDDPIETCFPLQADVQCRIAGRGRNHNWHGTVKLMMMKSHIEPSRGGHHPVEGTVGVRYLFGRQLAQFPYIGQAWFRFLVPLRVHHFKWTATLHDTLRRRLDTPGVSVAGAEYGGKLLAYIERHGRIRPEDVAIRQPSRLAHMSWRRRSAALRALSAAYWHAGRPRRLARKLKRGLSG
ncbi:glycosyltransferase family 2 protein [Salinisphaera sp. T31B1]|uniref:glycosyltransferase family 2 protein n=1 Tax=Salinisphaera sp. T31B1 TaxID=727963 RepID=UPI0033427867